MSTRFTSPKDTERKWWKVFNKESLLVWKEPKADWHVKDGFFKLEKGDLFFVVESRVAVTTLRADEHSYRWVRIIVKDRIGFLRVQRSLDGWFCYFEEVVL